MPAGPGGGVDFGGDIEQVVTKKGPAPIVLEERLYFSAAGTWKFYTNPDPPKTAPTPKKMEAPTVCFKIRKGACPRGSI